MAFEKLKGTVFHQVRISQVELRRIARAARLVDLPVNAFIVRASVLAAEAIIEADEAEQRAEALREFQFEISDGVYGFGRVG